MSTKIFRDNIFPRHVSDLMNQMHMMVFNGTDGEEKFATYLDLKQKEYISLGLAQYYQCEHCIEHHYSALRKLDKSSGTTILQNVSSMVLFLRIDTRTIRKAEQKHWTDAWHRFAKKICEATNDSLLPNLIGLAIGMARNDEFLITFCGQDVKAGFESKGIDLHAAIGELEAIVIFMKAAVSKNRIVEKIETLVDQ